MKNTNIENLVIFRNRGIYGYIVLYKSGRSRSGLPCGMLVLPNNIHRFMKGSPYSVAHDDNTLDYHEVIYYNRDIRN